MVDQESRAKAHEISRIAIWDGLCQRIISQPQAEALDKSGDRREEPQVQVLLRLQAFLYGNHTSTVWKDIYVQSDVPKDLHLSKSSPITYGGRGTPKQSRCFKHMDPSLWEDVKHNPKLLLEKIDYKRLLVLKTMRISQLADLGAVTSAFRDYINRPR